MCFEVRTVRVHVQRGDAEVALAPGELDELVDAGEIGPLTPVRVGDGPWRPARDLPDWAATWGRPAAWLRRAWDFPPVPWVTAVIVGGCLRVFVWGHGTAPGVRLFEAWSRESSAIVEARASWRLLSYGFVHASVAHVANNLAFLAIVGVALEVALGWEVVAALFVASVVAGGTLSGWMLHETPSVGASAGDYGFFAAAAVFGARYGDLLPPHRRTAFSAGLGLLALWAFVSGVFSPSVDNWGHAGGLLTGLLVGALVRPAGGDGRRHNRRVALALGGGALGWMLLVAALGPRLLPLEVAVRDGVSLPRPSWWREGMLPTQESGWLSRAGTGMLGVSTTRSYAPRDLDTAVADTRQAWTAAFDEVQFDAPHPVDIGGTPGVALPFVAGEWVGDTWVLARGRYVTTVTVLVPIGEAGVRARLEQAREELAIGVPDAVARARAHPDGGVRSLLERAGVAADLGELVEAWRLYDAARALAPRDPDLLVRWIEDRAAWGVPGHEQEALAAVRDHPDLRRVRVAAAEAIAARGAVAEARALLEEGLVRAPGDRALQAALDRLPVAPVPAAPE